MTIKNGYFIPEEDIFETLPDGRLIQLAAKGVPVAENDARRLGFIKDSSVGPSETKTHADAAHDISAAADINAAQIAADATRTINIGTPKPPTRTQKP